MSMNVISTAARQYANRPKDERFASVEAMIQDAAHQKAHCAEKTYNAKDLRAIVQGEGDQATVMLSSPKGAANLTHWSFGQLARVVGAPAGYLRDLPPQLAADCLNHGLRETEAGTDLQLLVQRANGIPQPTIRACTTDSYTRVWDSDIYGPIADTLMRYDRRWMLPPTWSGEPAGAYRSDRDSFLIIVNGGSIVQDPSLTGRVYSPSAPTQGAANEDRGIDPSGLYRGLIIRNSEVGAAGITIDQILFRYVCGNHMLWGAVIGKQFRRRHVGKADRATFREIQDIAFNWTNHSAGRDEQLIKHMIDRQIATTKEGVIDELKRLGYTKQQAEQAYTTCEDSENALSPRSFWGIVQGTTRMSQKSGYQDERYALDKLASEVMQKAAKQYATV